MTTGSGKPVTVWERWVGERRDQRLEHNHVEEGHVPLDQVAPTIKHEAQRAAWRQAQWVKTLAFLDTDGRLKFPLADNIPTRQL
jgi:hypothetical protein